MCPMLRRRRERDRATGATCFVNRRVAMSLKTRFRLFTRRECLAALLKKTQDDKSIVYRYKPKLIWTCT